MTGAELRAARKAAGLSQVALARRAAIGRHAVSYWEGKAAADLRGWAVRRMLKALGMPVLPVFALPSARAGAWALRREAERAEREWRAERERQAAAADLERLERQAARRQVACGARTRKGAPCRNLSVPGRRRCKFHGGRSTGPRTPEGRERIAAAQRRRWAAFREARATSAARGQEGRPGGP